MSLTVSELAGLQTTKYFNVAGVAILIFDYTITLEEEARWVWGRRWDVTRCIFTVSRYLPFVGVGLTAYGAVQTTCGPNWGVEQNIIHIIGIIAAELLLILRTYAFWQGNKRVLYGLLAYGCVTIAASVAVDTIRKQLFPGEQAPPGCIFSAGRSSTLAYMFLLLFEMVILFLTAYKRFRSYREVTESTVYTVYRDGMFYIACIMLITFTNVLVDGIFPFQFSDMLDIPQLTFHSVLASRILFNLRKSSHDLYKSDMTTDVVLSNMVYNVPSCSVSGPGSSGSESRGAKNVYDDIDVEMVAGPGDNTSQV